MKLCDIIRAELTFLELEARDCEEALGAVSANLEEATGLTTERIHAALLEREALGSTSVGNGFAIPHCKLTDLETIVVALARLAEGVEFNDGKNHPPVRFFFIVLSPPDQPTEHLQVLSQIARILKNGNLRDELMKAPDAEVAIESIQRAAELEGL